MEIQIYISHLLGQLAALLPLGYAFGAGMVSAVNPCGFAMLPVYLSLYLGVEDEEVRHRSIIHRFLRSIWVTLVVTCGFGLLFGLVGGVISAGGVFLQGVIPWVSVVIGIVLILLGVFMLTGRHFSMPFMLQMAAKIGDPRHISLKGFFLFGLGFGATSLSCTLPVFLTVVGGSLAGGDFFCRNPAIFFLYPGDRSGTSYSDLGHDLCERGGGCRCPAEVSTACPESFRCIVAACR